MGREEEGVAARADGSEDIPEARNRVTAFALTPAAAV
jgi:hypothetical protein